MEYGSNIRRPAKIEGSPVPKPAKLETAQKMRNKV